MSRKWNRAERLKHVRAWKASAKTRAEYAKKHGMSAASLTAWNSSFRDEGESTDSGVSPKAVPVTFAELSPIAELGPSSSIDLQVCGVVVRVTGEVDAVALAAVLDVVEARR